MPRFGHRHDPTIGDEKIMTKVFNSRNSSFGRPIREIVEALREGDKKWLEEVAEEVPLNDLDGDYHGVPVHPEYYDPDEMGRDLAVEILENDCDPVSEERAEAVIAGAAFTEAELKIIRKYVLDERAENCEGVYGTLWTADLADDTGFVSIIWHQYEDGSREFVCFVEDGSIYVSDMEAKGIEFV